MTGGIKYLCITGAVDVQQIFTIIILFGKATNINQDKMFVRIKDDNKMYKSISTE